MGTARCAESLRRQRLAEYVMVRFEEQFLNPGGDEVVAADCLRWSARVRHLVARCLAAALNDGGEELPPRPTLPMLPVHDSDGPSYVRLSGYPNPLRLFSVGALQTVAALT